MRNSWLVAGAIVAAAGSTPAAEVEIFGIHTPTLGKWAVYARVSQVDGTTGLASLSVDVLHNTVAGVGTTSVTTSNVVLPYGVSKYNDPVKFPSAPEVGYGFWFLRQNGTISGGDSKEIAASQWTTYEASDPIPYRDLILRNVGMTPGAAFKNDTTGGNFKTSAGTWGYPVMVASGSYTPAGATGTAAAQGLILAFTDPSASANLLRLTAQNDYTVEMATALKVSDARNFTLGASNNGTATVMARRGDANLNGIVNFDDLLLLAKNYNRQDAVWFEGDFDYNGIVNFDDLLALAQNYGVPAPSSPAFSDSFNAEVAAAFAAVPEPTALGFLGGMGALGLLSRRRRF